MITTKTLDFLCENRFRNSREWFLEHKEEYLELVLKPLSELAKELGPTVSAIDSQIITEPKVDRTISRIYRDTRFSKDKLLYREEMWLSFKRDKKVFTGYPEFFFAFTPEEFLFGCGYYAQSAQSMESLRKLILQNSPQFKKAEKAYKNQREFLLEGDMYKRSKFPDQPEEIRNWLDRKSISLIYRSKDFPLLFSDELAPLVKGIFNKMEAFYQLFLWAENCKED